MSLEIKSLGPPVAGIDELQSALGATLPNDYRDFLLRFNGGRPSPDVIDIPSLPGSPTDVRDLFGLGVAMETNDLIWNLSLIRGANLGRVLLPIARDSGGGLFCMSMEDGCLGRIFYLEMILSDHRELIPVADSFDEFLGKLRSYES
jgi:hypothetical protein